MLGVAAFAYFAFVDRHWLVALRVVTDIIHALAGIVAIGGVAVGRYLVVVRVLHLGALLLGILERVDGGSFVLRFGVFMS